MDKERCRKCDLQANADALADVLERLVAIMKHCDVSDGVCCCGEDMNTHSHPMNCGHSPTDHGAYRAGIAINDAVAALTAYRHQEGA